MRGRKHGHWVVASRFFWLGVTMLASTSACGPADDEGGSAAVFSEGHPLSSASSHAGQRCGTRNLTNEELLSAHEEAAAPSRGFTAPQTINVYFHVICKGSGTNCMGGVSEGNVPLTQIADQIKVLNARYAGSPATGLDFKLASVDYTPNNNWFFLEKDSKNERDMKNALHKGGKADLNVYTVYLADLLGWSTFPSDYQAAPWKDGVVILFSSLPGGSATPFDLGMTAVHEVGHWAGLFHTFQGGCSVFGDLVSDTPLEKEPSVGCPVGRNSCGILFPDPDPIHNYMDYSHDFCMTEFTSGQVRRIAEQMDKYRL